MNINFNKTKKTILPLLVFLFSYNGYSQEQLTSLLDSITNDSRTNHSTSLLVWYKGKLLIEDYEEGAKFKDENIQSITKGIANLAIGKLIGDGKIDSLDTPIHHFFPEWNQGRKKNITIRHLLNHTSGLQYDFKETAAANDILKFALASDVESEPGTQFKYSNKAINIITGIVEETANMPFEHYIQEAIFTPIGLDDIDWQRDYKRAAAFTGCKLRSNQLLKIGQLILNRGQWEGKQIIKEFWFDLIAPKQIEGYFFGNPGASRTMPLTWSLSEGDTEYLITNKDIELLKTLKVPQKTIDAFSEMAAKKKQTENDFLAAYRTLTTMEEKTQFAMHFRGSKNQFLYTKANVIGLNHTGGGGQYLFIFPEKELIIVRTVSEAKILDMPQRQTGWWKIYQWIHKLLDTI